MAGMLIGVVRMVLDFSYKAPLCTEEDTRPWIVGQVHYMYFAAFSFWMTGLVAFTVSQFTKPDPCYRVNSTYLPLIASNLKHNTTFQSMMNVKIGW